MVITPDSDVILLKCPLELDQANQLNFANATAQYNYFYSLPKKALTKYKYVRKDGVLAVGGVYDELADYNYVMYRNKNFTDKWFYAFIERPQFVSPETTWLYIKTDVFQTYQFDLTYKASFIEREHVNDDTIGANTIDEGLEYGEYIISSTKDIDYTMEQAYQTKSPFVAIGVTITPDVLNHVTAYTGAIYKNGKVNGIPSGVTYLYVSSDSINAVTRLYDRNSKSDAIVSMFVVPAKYLVTASASHGVLFNIESDDGSSFGGFTLDDMESSVVLSTETASAPSTIDRYTPKNGKLKCFPYCYGCLSNNGGMEAIYRWEDFTSRTATFKIEASMTQGMSIRAYPQNYLKGGNGKQEYIYGVTAQKMPACCWSTDFYLSWVNQQGANLGIQTGVNIGNTILGATVAGGMKGGIAGIAGGILGAGLNVFGQVANTMQQIREASLVPPQSRGTLNSGDVNFSVGKGGFTFYSMCIKAEYARQIDEYLSAYGYKIHRIKTPNITGRANWNYIKTIGCYILADIPQDDLQEIKNMFDNGVTIWHNPSTFRDYSQSNAIVS